MRTYQGNLRMYVQADHPSTDLHGCIRSAIQEFNANEAYAQYKSTAGYFLALERIQRHEVVLRHQGSVVGCAVLQHVQDLHVGECVHTLCSYVLPEHRCASATKALLKGMRECTGMLGCKFLVTSSHTGGLTFKVHYRKV